MRDDFFIFYQNNLLCFVFVSKLRFDRLPECFVITNWFYVHIIAKCAIFFTIFCSFFFHVHIFAYGPVHDHLYLLIKCLLINGESFALKNFFNRACLFSTSPKLLSDLSSHTVLCWKSENLVVSASVFWKLCL